MRFDLIAFLKLENYVCEELSNQEFERINGLPLAQKRSSVYKKYVFLDLDNQVVIKGPYTIECKKLKREIVNNYLITMCEDFLALEHTCIPILRVLFFETNYFLEFPNIGFPNPEYALASNMVDKNKKVSLRHTQCLRVSDIEKNLRPGKMLDLTLQHLYFRYIVGCGDMGTHNILCKALDSDSVYGVDFEECCVRHFPNNKLQCLMRVSPLKKFIYESHLKSLKLFDKYLPNDILQKIVGFGLDPRDFEERIKLFQFHI